LWDAAMIERESTQAKEAKLSVDLDKEASLLTSQIFYWYLKFPLPKKSFSYFRNDITFFELIIAKTFCKNYYKSCVFGSDTAPMVVHLPHLIF
jgi:hypothetical protein